MLRPLLLLYFASGCAALIYETAWFHLVQLMVGASSISVAVLLCSFMGGMALGSAWLPRLMPATAVVAWTLARTHPEVRLKPDATADDGATRLNHATAGASLTPNYVVAAMSGFTALGAEVVWTRQLSLLFGASVYTFSLILAVFLTGLGAGSLAGSALGRRSSDPALWLGRVHLCLAAAMVSAPG